MNLLKCAVIQLNVLMQPSLGKGSLAGCPSGGSSNVGAHSEARASTLPRMEKQPCAWMLTPGTQAELTRGLAALAHKPPCRLLRALPSPLTDTGTKVATSEGHMLKLTGFGATPAEPDFRHGGVDDTPRRLHV